MARTTLSATCISALLFLCPIGLADDTPVNIVPVSASSAPHAHLRIDSSLVLIPAHVTTPNGTSVTSLTQENFKVFEDNVEQKITHFSLDDAPVSIGLLFDSSGSMHNKMRKSSEAAATFFKTANPDDEFFLVEFSERAKLTVPFTPDSDEIYRQILRNRPFGRTSLLDAIHLGLQHMKHARNLRKALVILSDGGDNRSRYTAGEIKNAMLESDVQVYAMGIFEPPDSHKLSPEEQNGPRLLDELADHTGGRLFTVDHLDELPTISERIGNELRNEYLIAYSPANESRDGKFRRVKVNLTPPPEMSNLRIYFRHGYYAPAE